VKRVNETQETRIQKQEKQSIMDHNFENLDIWKRGCRELMTQPFANTDAMIEEKREISRMLSGFIGHLKPPPPLSLDSCLSFLSSVRFS